MMTTFPGINRFSSVGIIRIERQRCFEFCFALVELACLTVKNAQITMEMRGFGAIAAGLQRFLSLLNSLRPILRRCSLHGEDLDVHVYVRPIASRDARCGSRSAGGT